MINRLRIAYAIIRPSLNFLQKRRERRAAALREEREHQLAMLRLLTGVLTKQAETTAQQVTVIADAVRSQTEIIQTWLKGFHVQHAPVELPNSVAQSDPDDLLELEAFAAANGIAPEFALALALNKGAAPSNEEVFDRETGSDF